MSLDVADAALARARQHCADLPNVEIRKLAAPQQWPGGTFDLILWSEVLYFLGRDGIIEAAAKTRACLTPNGTALLVNWLGDTGTSTTGDQAAILFIQHANLTPSYQTRTARYRLDHLTQTNEPPLSPEP